MQKNKKATAEKGTITDLKKAIKHITVLGFAIKANTEPKEVTAKEKASKKTTKNK